jgi:hypothetical protein
MKRFISKLSEWKGEMKRGQILTGDFSICFCYVGDGRKWVG